jgi:hypothetical protein
VAERLAGESTRRLLPHHPLHGRVDVAAVCERCEMKLALPPAEQAVQPYDMPGRHRPPATAPLGRAPGEILADHVGEGPRECSVLLVRPGQDPQPHLRMVHVEGLSRSEHLTSGGRVCQGKEGASAFIVLIPALPGT